MQEEKEQFQEEKMKFLINLKFRAELCPEM